MDNMRTNQEIARAHDMIVGILLGDAPNPFHGDNAPLVAAADVLCWVLGHEHNVNFARNLEAIETFMREAGVEIRRNPWGEA